MASAARPAPSAPGMASTAAFAGTSLAWGLIVSEPEAGVAAARVVGSVLLLALFWWWENPRHPRHATSRGRGGAASAPAWMLPAEPGARDVLRAVLDALGFFHTFGFASVGAVLVKAQLHASGVLFVGAWRAMVAYVSANHFLYLLHAVVKSSAVRPELCSNPEGVGQRLKGSSWWVFCVAVFNEHRLADVWVHCGHLLGHPWRVDHWLALVAHVLRYGGRGGVLTRGATLCEFDVGVSLDDFVDCFAHTVSGVRALGWYHFGIAAVAMEALRYLLDANAAMHHTKRSDACHSTGPRSESTSQKFQLVAKRE